MNRQLVADHYEVSFDPLSRISGRYDRDRGGGGGVNAAFSFFGTEEEVRSLSYWLYCLLDALSLCMHCRVRVL